MSIRKYIDGIKDHVDVVLRPRRIDDAVQSLEPGAFVATITAPSHAGLDDLMNLAEEHGISTSENEEAKLRLIPADSASEVHMDDPVRILLLPAAKRHRKALRKLDADQARQAWLSHENLSENSHAYDIILDEGESTRKTLLTLIHKIDLLLTLREIQQRAAPEGADQMNCFIIWAHGLRYKNEILTMISQHFQVITVQERDDLDITRFIRDIYIEEILRVGYHIAKKNKHLLKHRRKAALVLARNRSNNENFTCHGHGPDRRVCSSMEEHLKQTVRDRYNPRKDSGARIEQHVIHGSHAPLQIENTLRAFGLKPLREWLTDEQKV